MLMKYFKMLRPRLFSEALAANGSLARAQARQNSARVGLWVSLLLLHPGRYLLLLAGGIYLNEVPGTPFLK